MEIRVEERLLLGWCFRSLVPIRSYNYNVELNKILFLSSRWLTECLCWQCSNNTCRVAYHPLCARAAGLCVEVVLIFPWNFGYYTHAQTVGQLKLAKARKETAHRETYRFGAKCLHESHEVLVDQWLAIFCLCYLIAWGWGKASSPVNRWWRWRTLHSSSLFLQEAQTTI